MAVSIPQFNLNATVSVDRTFPTLSTQGMGSISFLLFTSAETTLKIVWSPDGINGDIIDSTVVAAGTAEHVLYNIKASYVSVVLDLTVASATNIRLDSFFFL